MRKITQKAALAALLSVALSSCTWLECSVLCEGFYAQSMTNPKTGQHVTCGNYVQKGELTRAQRDEMNACIADYESKGFVSDKK